MIIKIEFPFVDRRQTSNKKKDSKTFLSREQTRNLKEKANTYVYLAKRNYKIETPYYGAILHRFWFFENAVPKDYDNFFAGTKYYTDALVSQGLILKDDNHHLLVGKVHMFEKQPKEKMVYVLELMSKTFFLAHNRDSENYALNLLETLK